MYFLLFFKKKMLRLLAGFEKQIIAASKNIFLEKKNERNGISSFK